MLRNLSLQNKCHIIMHKAFYNIFASLILVLVIVIFISGCKSNKIIMKPEAEKRDVNTANQQGAPVDYEDAVKQHYEMQSESTKQMMIRSDKSRKQYNTGISRSWYDELFNSSCFNNSCMVKTGHSYVTITKSRSCFIKD